MLRTLGYDPNANPPNYGQPDPDVADNTIHIKQNSDFWKQRELDVMNDGAADVQQPQAPPAETSANTEKVSVKEGQVER